MSDPYTMSVKLCDEDGIVRGGAMHDGRDYPCTGHAHTFGEHIFGTSPAHDRPGMALPKDLARVLSDPSIMIERDGLVWALIGRAHTRGTTP